MALPAACAEQIRSASADVGLVPVAEIARQGLTILGDAGIACEGPVRSILLFSRKPWAEVRSLAGDSGSRTSVGLAQVLLRAWFGAHVVMRAQPPNLEVMLAAHDAALIIGDPALRLDSSQLPYHCLDLGELWTRHTGLPMVFAAWAGSAAAVAGASPELFADSRNAGLANLEAIVEKEATPRGITNTIALDYLRHHIRYFLGERERQGMREFLARAARHGLLEVAAAEHPALAGKHPVGKLEEH